MHTYESCTWLKCGSTELCNKNCLKQYCKVHLLQIRQNHTPLRPCRGCGKGTNSESLLCRPCGNVGAQMRLIRTEKKARTIFSKVMVELLKHFEI